MSKNKRTIRWGLRFVIALNGFVWCGLASLFIDNTILEWVFNAFAVASGFTGIMAWDAYTSKKRNPIRGNCDNN